MKVVLHIGPHKTGTTTIQRFLFANARALRKHGIFYPKPWDGRYKHDAVAYGLRTPSLYDDTVRRVRGLLDEAARDRARLHPVAGPSPRFGTGPSGPVLVLAH